MFKTQFMKYVLLCLVAIISASVGYHFGCVSSKQEDSASAKQKLVEDALMGHLLCNLTVYQNLQNAAPGLAKDNIKAYLKGDVATYDFYRKEVPTFGDKTEHLHDFVNQARAIQEEK